jgi:diphosphomevalonate decarboxylase
MGWSVKKVDVIQVLLGQRLQHSPIQSSVSVFAPTNIALCKYWGKRNEELNLPVTSSLSISLGNKGATTLLKMSNADQITLNDKTIELTSVFGKRLIDFLALFRKPNEKMKIAIHANIPIAAGLASSAAGFASLAKALNECYQWNLSLRELSILSRLGSGSACRSLWSGFVEWCAGSHSDGMDSHGEELKCSWPELCVGLLLVNEKEKAISSREAMLRTVKTSTAYSSWPQKVNDDLSALKHAINKKEFERLGKTAESNALMMHAMMLTADPPIQYSTPETIALMQKIWKLRNEGLAIYFTQDAGPNLKLLFLEENAAIIAEHFPNMEIVRPFLSS